MYSLHDIFDKLSGQLDVAVIAGTHIFRAGQPIGALIVWVGILISAMMWIGPRVTAAMGEDFLDAAIFRKSRNNVLAAPSYSSLHCKFSAMHTNLRGGARLIQSVHFLLELPRSAVIKLRHTHSHFRHTTSAIR